MLKNGVPDGTEITPLLNHVAEHQALEMFHYLCMHISCYNVTHSIGYYAWLGAFGQPSKSKLM